MGLFGRGWIGFSLAFGSWNGTRVGFLCHGVGLYGCCFLVQVCALSCDKDYGTDMFLIYGIFIQLCLELGADAESESRCCCQSCVVVRCVVIVGPYELRSGLVLSR